MEDKKISLMARLRKGSLLTAAGVFDVLSALLAQRAGFEAAFLSGSALANAQLGRPDVGMLTATELADIVGRICDRVRIPVFVDADHGFGNAINVYRTTRLLERAGAGGIQLEDRREAVPPRDIRSRPVIDAGLMADKIRAAADARASPETLISARTDALFSASIDESLSRAESYIEAGADMIFVEGCATPGSRRDVAAVLSERVPLLFNAGILDAGALPGRRELERLGYAMVVFPANMVSAAAQAMQQALAEIRTWAGEVPPPRGVDLPAVIATDAFISRFI